MFQLYCSTVSVCACVYIAYVLSMVVVPGEMLYMEAIAQKVLPGMYH